MTGTQTDLPIANQMQRREMSEMELLTLALQNNATLDVVERIAAMREAAIAKHEQLEFNVSFSSLHQEVGRVARDGKAKENEMGGHRWATYEAMDKELRPLYFKHGIIPTFYSEDGREPNSIRVICELTKGGCTRRFTSASYPVDGSGPKGGGLMSKDQAVNSALSFARRRLVEFIFNIPTGDSDDPNFGMEDGVARIEEIKSAEDVRSLTAIFNTHYKAAKDQKNGKAMLAFIAARDERKRAFLQ